MSAAELKSCEHCGAQFTDRGELFSHFRVCPSEKQRELMSQPRRSAAPKQHEGEKIVRLELQISAAHAWYLALFLEHVDRQVMARDSDALDALLYVAQQVRQALVSAGYGPR